MRLGHVVREFSVCGVCMCVCVACACVHRKMRMVAGLRKETFNWIFFGKRSATLVACNIGWEPSTGGSFAESGGSFAERDLQLGAFMMCVYMHVHIRISHMWCVHM